MTGKARRKLEAVERRRVTVGYILALHRSIQKLARARKPPEVRV